MTKPWKRATLIALVAVMVCGVALEALARGARRRQGRERDREVRQEDVLGRANRKFYFYYNLGIELEGREEWKRAKDNFLLALSVDPEPARQKPTSGNQFIEYYPYYKLANAYYQLGEIRNAEKYLRQSESKSVAPPDRVGALWALIIEGRQEPQVYLYQVEEQTFSNFIDIRGIAFDYHEITGIMVGEREAEVREATIDEVKALPSEPRLGFEPLDTVYFEVLGFPLRTLGENRISIRADATNPERKSDLLELVVFRKVEREQERLPAALAAEQAAAAPAADDASAEDEVAPAE